MIPVFVVFIDSMDEFTSEQELSVVYEEETVDLLPTEFNLR